MNQRPTRPLGLLALVLASAASLLACGGRSPNSLHQGLDGGANGVVAQDGDVCPVLACPQDAPWNPDICACEAMDDAGAPVVTDAMAQCPPLACPADTTLALLGTSCVCLVDSQDASADGEVAPSDAPYSYDGPSFYYDAPYYPDAWYGVYDAPYYPTDSTYCPYTYWGCPTGYTLSPSCTCDLCPATCPSGQTPGPGCNGCNACTTTCPAGFDYGPSCTCVPHGVDAGPRVPSDAGDAGASCLLEGYTNCPAGSWCQLGTCPNATTQYGCYCDRNGKATCSLSCPEPAPCDIPGQTACPYGEQCVYGSCAASPAGALLVCSCNNSYGDAASAYCYTASCADGGPQYLSDASPPSGGVTCLLGGYTTCNAGSWCPLGTCPGGTQYGCFCNQDGTSTCDLSCPPPPACQIPGEGTCPYGTSCVFGCGSGSSGTGLSCYCGWGGSANCNTVPCSQIGDAGGGPG